MDGISSANAGLPVEWCPGSAAARPWREAFCAESQGGLALSFHRQFIPEGIAGRTATQRACPLLYPGG